MREMFRSKPVARRVGTIRRTVVCSLLGAASLTLCTVGTAQAVEPAPVVSAPTASSLPDLALDQVLPLVVDLLGMDFHDWG
ncbi:hypothetical protein J5Y04_21970 [Kitasatospora sp. RG8]|uniref:hypothetical protein n=1 Tax=Kitasatospora sp. RG8 TaxID=2820815 RepID=UPI001ADFCE27|nr:hypothetical protein [Kitasatospora sp. RG8]MBP0452187.1 hypothetical protein [Kitasatospora sp. RG8]